MEKIVKVFMGSSGNVAVVNDSYESDFDKDNISDFIKSSSYRNYRRKYSIQIYFELLSCENTVFLQNHLKKKGSADG